MDDIYLPNIWVTESIRNSISRKCNLKDPASYRLAQYLLFSGQRDIDDPHLIVLSRNTVYYLCGKKTIHEALTLVDIPCDVIIGKTPGKATTVYLHKEDGILDLKRSICLDGNRNKRDKVDFISGKPWTMYRERKSYEEQAKQMESYDAPGHPADELIRYLHSSRVRRTVKGLLADNNDLIMETIDDLREDRKERAHAIYDSVMNSYLAYKTVANSPRIYGSCTNIMQLPREVRRAVYHGCWDLDIQSAQLAIVAKLWNVPELLPLIRENWWQSLFKSMGRAYDEQIKNNELKPLTYSIIFGGGIRRMRELSPKYATLFNSIPIIQTLISHRENALSEIRSAGGIVDAFGQHYTLNDVIGKKYDDERVRSLLSRQVQSYEVGIMLNLHEELRQDNDIVLCGWLHDGCYIKLVNHKEDAEYKLARISEKVAKLSIERYDIEIKINYKYI